MPTGTPRSIRNEKRGATPLTLVMNSEQFPGVSRSAVTGRLMLTVCLAWATACVGDPADIDFKIIVNGSLDATIIARATGAKVLNRSSF